MISRRVVPLAALLAVAFTVALLAAGRAPAATPTETASSTEAGTAAESGPAAESGAAVSGTKQDGGVIGPGQRPQLLLIHGGSFLFEDPKFEALTRSAALAAGFVPHYVIYPLDDLPAAIDRVRAEARRLRQKFGVDRVYAYGASAGGTLAALLSGDHLVSAAVAKAPISDFVTWVWPLGRYGPDFYEKLGVGLAAREQFSPIRRPQRAPLLVIQGRADNVVPATMNEAFASVYPRVRLWLVAGGHQTERARPFLVTRAMEWLGRQAALTLRGSAATKAATTTPTTTENAL